MTGDNIENDAQKRIDELQKEKESLNSELEKLKQMHDADQEQINKMGNEVGDYRKKLDAIEKDLNDLKESKKESAPTESRAKTDTDTKEAMDSKQKLDAEIEKLQSLLTEEDDEALNQHYESADPDVQAAIDNDPQVRAKFIQNYLGERAVPKRTWRRTTDNAGNTQNNREDIVSKVELLFNKKKKENNYTPTGSVGGRHVPDGRGSYKKTDDRVRSKGVGILGLNRNNSSQPITNVKQG